MGKRLLDCEELGFLADLHLIEKRDQAGPNVLLAHGATTSLRRLRSRTCSSSYSTSSKRVPRPAQAIARLLDALKEPRIALQPVFEPVVVRCEADKSAGGLAVPGDDDFLVLR